MASGGCRRPRRVGQGVLPSCDEAAASSPSLPSSERRERSNGHGSPFVDDNRRAGLAARRCLSCVFGDASKPVINGVAAEAIASPNSPTVEASFCRIPATLSTLDDGIFNAATGEARPLAKTARCAEDDVGGGEAPPILLLRCSSPSSTSPGRANGATYTSTAGDGFPPRPAAGSAMPLRCRDDHRCLHDPSLLVVVPLSPLLTAVGEGTPEDGAIWSKLTLTLPEFFCVVVVGNAEGGDVAFC
nr:hypothetical protein Iba_chr02dCG4140 [Ipomoea batatas]